MSQRIKIVLIAFFASFASGCFIEGGGCSGPICFGVSTDICGANLFCSDDENQGGRCPDADVIEADAINLITSARMQSNSCDLPSSGNAVVWSRVLFSSADLHSLDMASNNFVSDLGSDGLGVTDRLAGSGFASASQSVAGGFADASDVVTGWLSDNRECMKILDSAVSEFALACRYDSDSQYGTYWTLVMAGS